MAKRKVDLFAAEKAAANSQAAAQLVHYVKNLQALADGGFEAVDEEWVPAGLILIDDQGADDDGILAAAGVNTRHMRRPKKVLAFPDLPPDQLVLVKRKRTTMAPDRSANIYLLDRIIGRPEVTTNINTGEGANDGQPTNIQPEELKDLWTSTPSA
jgi:hypothetical protein